MAYVGQKINSMKRVKLSSISVNAATLGGQSPDFYNFRRFGLGTSTNSVTPIVGDFNQELETGFYAVYGYAENGPGSVSPGTSLLHIKRIDSYCIQILFGGNGGIRIRTKSNNVWGSWVDV